MSRFAPVALALVLMMCLCGAHASGATGAPQPVPHRTISDRSFSWPSLDQWRRVLELRDYNTRIVIVGTTLLGCAAGLVGSFTLLRKRALMGDALSHATLPGICLAFMLATSLHGSAKSLPVLLTGATISGLIGVGTILLIRNLTRLKEDTALGAVLSVFFGGGTALLGIVQQMREGHAAGLESFIYGRTASMGIQDTQLIAGAALACVVVCLLLFKEFKLLCFDEGFAGSRGYPVPGLDSALMTLVVIVTIVGLQAVGLILMVALLVIPAAAARFWTDRLQSMFAIAGGLGAASGMAGAAMSALFSKLPSGAMIVLVCALFFLVSMACGTQRGVLVRFLRRWHLNRSVDRQHLLRAVYEIAETSQRRQSGLPVDGQSVSFAELLTRRSWTAHRLTRAIRKAQRGELIEWGDDPVRLTRRGQLEAARLTRQHRLWELYLITHADIAPSRVDRDADAIEHVLEPEVIAELEVLLERKYPDVPVSPHELTAPQSIATAPAREA